MPREIARKPRFIYPTIATSLSIAQVSALAELLFWRILPQADDQGRLTGQPKQLKAIACPMRDEITGDNIPALLKELEDASLIIQYSASSEPLIQIKSWWNFQSGMRRIYPSKYPAPEGWQDRTKGVSGGQEPTNAPIVPPNQVISISGNQVISKPEAVVAPPTTGDEKEILHCLEHLKGWQADEDDVLWLQGLEIEIPGLTLADFKACIDYHSGRPVPKHKGIWKNRFRNWMTKKQEYERRKGEQPRKPKQERAKGPIKYIRGSEEPGPEDSEDMPGMR
jgi:hypothetical protein